MLHICIDLDIPGRRCNRTLTHVFSHLLLRQQRQPGVLQRVPARHAQVIRIFGTEHSGIDDSDLLLRLSLVDSDEYDIRSPEAACVRAGSVFCDNGLGVVDPPV